MILSDKQRHSAVREIENFKRAISAIEEADFEEEWHREIQIKAIQSEIESLQQQVLEYDMLKSGGITIAKSFSLEKLPEVLVQARIASGLTQTDLASRLNLKPQQIQRYESSEYQGASLARLIEISEALGVTVEGNYRNRHDEEGGIFNWTRANDIRWERFPIREMVKRKWFVVAEDEDEIQATKRYFEIACDGPTLSAALHRKKVRSSATIDEYALLAWQACILQRANLTIQNQDIPEFVLDESWLPRLRVLTQRKDGPKKAINLLAEHGIVLVIEKHFNSTCLDGAAMLNDDGNPIIGLTLRQDRLDNFWFVLFHELGHVFLHLMSGQSYDFFDDDEASTTDTLERSANNFALDNLIKPSEWEECKSRHALSAEAIKVDAARLNIGASVIAGRIRKERGDYSLLSSLVGQSDVQIQFES